MARYASLHRVALDKTGQVLGCEVVSEVGDPCSTRLFHPGRRELLEEVREQFLSIPTMRQFGLWLNEQIAAVTEKPAPKLRVVSK